jgi:hypothetical protein
MLRCIYYECCNPPVQMPSLSMRRRRQHPPPPPLNCHDHHVLSSLCRCCSLICPPIHPVAGSWTCSITTTAPTGRKGCVPPASCCSPPHRRVFTIVTAIAVFVFPTGCRCHRHCQRIEEGAVLVLRGRDPDVPRRHGPGGVLQGQGRVQGRGPGAVVGLTGRLQVGGVKPAQLLPVGAAALPDSQSHRSWASLPSREGHLPRSSSLELPNGDWFGIGVDARQIPTRRARARNTFKEPAGGMVGYSKLGMINSICKT